MNWKLATLAIVASLTTGVLAGRAWFPRIQTLQVDREVLRVVEKLVPGETRTIIKEVSGPERRVEVPVIVEKIGPDRVRTVTEAVPVPVEVIRERWPQTITVRVGSVLTDRDEWAVPKFTDLLIGQVAPGIYAVPAEQPGWRVDSVRTETRINPDPDSRARWHLEIRPAAGFIGLGPTFAAAAGVEVMASRAHTVVTLAGGKSTAGDWVLLLGSYRF